MLLNKIIFHSQLKSKDGVIYVHATIRFSQTEFEIRKTWAEINDLMRRINKELDGGNDDDGDDGDGDDDDALRQPSCSLDELNAWFHRIISNSRYDETMRLFVSDDDESSLFELLDAELSQSLKPYAALRRRVHEVAADARSSLASLSRHDLAFRVASTAFDNNVVYYVIEVRLAAASAASSATTYSLSRRFREFVALDAQLRSNYKEVSTCLPQLPAHGPSPSLLLRGSTRANLSPADIERRRRALNEYLQAIRTSPVLRTSVEVQIFIAVYLHVPRILRRELDRIDNAAELDQNILLTRVSELEEEIERLKNKKS